MRKMIVSLCLLVSVTAFTQAEKKNQDPAMSAKEAARFEKLLQLAKYPLVKSDPMTGYIPVEGIDAWPDTKQVYKLVFNVTVGTKDTAKAKETNFGLVEVGRILNLHLASGIPKKNIEIVVLTHGPSIFALENDSDYQEKFHVNNPNKTLVKELQDAGVTFIVCGQAMSFLDVEKKQLLPGVKVALTAQTMLSSYQLKGFVLYNEAEEE